MLVAGLFSLAAGIISSINRIGAIAISILSNNKTFWLLHYKTITTAKIFIINFKLKIFNLKFIMLLVAVKGRAMLL